jgi:hypothetical protein
MIISLCLAFVAGLIYCDEKIASLNILIYEDGDVVSEKFEAEREYEKIKFSAFYEVTENTVRRHYTYGKDVQTIEYVVISRERDKDKRRISAVNSLGGKIKIILFPNNHAIIIYYDEKMLSIEEALFIERTM